MARVNGWQLNAPEWSLLMILFPDDSYLPEDEARKKLEKYEPGLRDCVSRAFEAICEAGRSVPILGRAMPGSLMAQMMNAVVVQAIREFYDGREDCLALDERGFLELQVGGEIDLRFKLVNRSGRSRNYPTQTDRQYRNQLPLNGDDVVETARVTVGWRWNASATELEDISVVYAKGDNTEWMYSISDADEASDAISAPTPVLPSSGDSAARGRFGSKTVKKTNEQEGA